MRFVSHEYPEIEKIPKDFLEIIALGKKRWTAELLGYEFEFGRLAEWEEREIAKRIDNKDPTTKSVLLRVDTLVQAIVKIRTPSGKEYKFESYDEKMLLKHVLNACDPYVVNYLYHIYNLGASQIESEIENVLGKLEEVAVKNFFEVPGEFSELLGLKTQPTQDSSR